MNIIRWWQHFNLDRLIRTSPSAHYHPGAVSTKHFVGILFSMETGTDLTLIKQFIQTIGSRVGPCVSLAYKPYTLDRELDFGYLHFSRSDLNIQGIPASPNILRFSRRHFSHLINIDPHDHLPLHYICHMLEAPMKVSISKRYDQMYDLQVEPDAQDTYAGMLAKTLDIFSKIS